jgi:hypothetical protein
MSVIDSLHDHQSSFLRWREGWVSVPVRQEPRGRANADERASSAERVAKRRPVGAQEVRA